MSERQNLAPMVIAPPAILREDFLRDARRHFHNVGGGGRTRLADARDEGGREQRQCGLQIGVVTALLQQVLPAVRAFHQRRGAVQSVESRINPSPGVFRLPETSL